MGTIRNSERIIWEKRGTEWEKLERETNHERPLTLGNTKGCRRGDGWGNRVTGCWALKRAWDKHWMFYYMLAN